MKLLMTPTSPYARKARVIIAEKSINCEQVVVAPWDDDPQVLAANPLRKVPALLTDDGHTLLDSRVICAYLDGQGEAMFYPEVADKRVLVESRAALVEGAMDSLLAIIMAGRAAPDMQLSGSWKNWLMDKAKRTLALLEKDIAGRSGFDISDIACYSFLDFWLFRMGDMDWRPNYPQMAAWFEKTAGRPSITVTDPRNA